MTSTAQTGKKKAKKTIHSIGAKFGVLWPVETALANHHWNATPISAGPLFLVTTFTAHKRYICLIPKPQAAAPQLTELLCPHCNAPQLSAEIGHTASGATSYLPAAVPAAGRASWHRTNIRLGRTAYRRHGKYTNVKQCCALSTAAA